jgi:phosphatidylinositol-3-phosphatase
MFAKRAAAGGIMAVTLMILTGCTSGGSSDVATSSTNPPATDSTTAGAAVALPTPDHVMVVIFENEDASDIVGASDAPYLTSLAESGATLTDAHAVTHPSQPNYLALFSGSTQGVTGNDCPQTFSGPNLAEQLQAAGRSFVGYSEDLPRAGYTGCETGDYARKHNPWVNFSDLPASVNQPFTALPEDFSALPTVSFVVPNLCNDMHDCGVAAGDDWAQQNLSDYVTWAQAHNSLLLVTFDEDSGSSANRIATFLVGPMVKVGTSDQRIDHYSLLRTVEDMYGLPPLGKAADAEPLTGIWTTSPR